jgi:hypothetical protein
VGQATTEADGSFAIRLDPAAASDVADEAIRSGGWVNFDVVASDGTLVADATVGRKIMLAGWGDGEGPAPITVVLASGAEGVTSAGTSARRRLAARNRILAGFPICVTWNREKIADGIGWGVIGELHTGLDQTAKFSYGERADSNISVGVSADDIHYRGISGSVHIGTDKSDELSSEIGWRRGANFGYQLETTFKFEKWKYTRYCPISKKVEYRIIAKEWLPNQRTGKDVRSFDHHCLEKPLEYRFRGDKDGWFSRTNTSAYTYSAGVSVFGISLGIKSGYSKWVDSRWDFGHKYDAYWLCGDDGHPKKSHRIFAGG